jgi:hypothetical protein
MKKDTPRLKVILTDTLGVLLMIGAILFGWLPGPGGIPLFVAGLGLLAVNHEWARKWLHNFDQKRLYYTEKFLVGSHRMKWTIDIVCVALIALGIAILATPHQLVVRLLGTALVSLSVIVLLSNQKRFDRALKKIKRKK